MKLCCKVVFLLMTALVIDCSQGQQVLDEGECPMLVGGQARVLRHATCADLDWTVYLQDTFQNITKGKVFLGVYDSALSRGSTAGTIATCGQILQVSLARLQGNQQSTVAFFAAERELAASVHALPCQDEMAGEPWKLDNSLKPNHRENEFWFTAFRVTSNGEVTSEPITRPFEVNEQARSVVIYDLTAPINMNNKVACCNLS
ncbi:hypothetical protein QOT17_010190 [Balamuthia mandrillaris]